MSKFQFNLEQVLKYRVQLEEQASIQHAQAKQAHDIKKAELEELKQLLQNHEKEWSNKIEFSPSELWLARHYETALKEDINITTENVTALYRELERCRNELIKKAQERELLEKLKLKQAERYEYEERQKELKINDETATLRYGIKPV
ncbi:flagellar export protein FliJ [Desulfovibrio litoralis]|uniref:Flagellar FliJ protein n=1 Tax=Desulfovibrio litoralis DSM 11393 TaxID=1121455 RepID=A0A1M7TIV9_9BACT|nr:flagellar export protein FliJ [Desulfovibrio litoralis]SHN70650.1 flagellar FliJ protein [Desulfovibrio litoralis DSM 11393]